MVYLYDEAVSMQEYLFGNPKDDIGRELIFDLPVCVLCVGLSLLAHPCKAMSHSLRTLDALNSRPNMRCIGRHDFVVNVQTKSDDMFVFIQCSDKLSPAVTSRHCHPAQR